jgi:hypothetical protein
VIVHSPTESRLHPLRVGRLTASRVGAMLAKTKSGPSAQRADLLWELVCERLTGESAERDFTPTRQMQRGIDMEVLAVAAFEAANGSLVEPGGFMEREDCLAGVSPDGIIDGVELLEVKCPATKTLIGWHRLGPNEIPAQHLPQLIHALWVSGFQAVTLFGWDDRLPNGLQTFIRRLHRDDVDLDQHEVAVHAFLGEVNAALDHLHTLQKEQTHGQETE